MSKVPLQESQRDIPSPPIKQRLSGFDWFSIVFTGLFMGGFVGAIIGAILLGLIFMGPSRANASHTIGLGLLPLFCVPPGALLGVVIALVRASRR